MHPAPSAFHLTRSGDRGLTVRRGFSIPGQRLLRAHLDPDILPRWLVAPDMPPLTARIDPRPGGRFNLTQATPDPSRPDDLPCVLSGQFIDLADTRIRLEADNGAGLQAGFGAGPGAGPGAGSGAGPIQITLQIDPEAQGTLLTLALRYPDRHARDIALALPLGPPIERAYLRLDALLQD